MKGKTLPNKKKKSKKSKIKILIFAILSILVLLLLYDFNIIPHMKYSNAKFDITPYISQYDKDLDGIDDQSDILQNAKIYVSKRPKYKSVYYNSGYPNDEYGVCTDVVGFAFLNAGYNLMDLVNSHIQNNPDLYNIEVFDKNIEFRRVFNLKVFFDYNATSLTLDVNEIDEWQGGDIVIFKTTEGHIGIVSDNRNKNGVPFVIHHANPYQIHYEEDILENREDIIGHYRFNLGGIE